MSTRKPLSKSVRFEVFKRDSFTCQYCGAKAPEAILHCDHINPVANGGDNAIMNLVTACADCNGGKAARTLDDRTVVERQRAQVEELQSRREQLEMMLQWRDAEQASAVDVVNSIADRLARRGGFFPSESGKQDIRRWLKRFSVPEVLAALDEAFDSYMAFNGDEPIQTAWELAFKKIPAIANLRRQAVERPHVVKLAYIQAILRRRFHDPRGNYFQALEDTMTDWEIGVDTLEDFAKACSSWDDFCGRVEKWWRKKNDPDIQAETLAQYRSELAREEAEEARREAARQQAAEEQRAYDAAYDDGYDNDGCDD